MSSQEIIRDVSADRVDQIVAGFVAIGATVQKLVQANGLFTIIATFDGSVHLSPMATETAAEAVAPLAQVPDHPLPAINPSTDFPAVSAEYRAFFDTCEIRSNRRAEVQARVSRLLDHAPRYKALGEQLGMPWFFIAIIHSLEAGSNFATHLHNGDPLTSKTTHVPAGRPASGSAPFTWEASARDALAMKGYVGQTDWSTSRMLHRWEAYNGFGYRTRGLASPYLWSFSQHYTKGRFVKDHVFDPDSVSQQCGAAVLLLGLQGQA